MQQGFTIAFMRAPAIRSLNAGIVLISPGHPTIHISMHDSLRQEVEQWFRRLRPSEPTDTEGMIMIHAQTTIVT